MRASDGRRRRGHPARALIFLGLLVISTFVSADWWHFSEPVRAAGLQAPAETSAQPAFRGGVDLVSLNVTVMDGPRYATNLEAEDFQVFEDGVKQDVTYFTRINMPVALALLLDTSASMDTRLRTAQEAAVGFATRLRDQDLAAIVEFNSRVNILQGFSGNPRELEAAIRRTSASGSTSLYNAVYIALKELKKISVRNVEDVRRQAIVLLSDGEDTSSLVSFEEVLDLAKRSETSIYTIGIRPNDGPAPAQKGFKEAEFVLRQFSQETGGRSFFPNQFTDLGAVYGEISDELSNRYTIGYTSKNSKRDGAWRRVVVRLGRPNLSTRTKLGYFAATPG